jgi:hypothetical protein
MQFACGHILWRSDMARLFLSYRRDDTEAFAGRLFDRLSVHFGQDIIFMDYHTIEPGLDFVQTIEKAVRSCNVLIALIGPNWLTSRLENPQDYVRLEIATALKRNIRVIPLLIHGASMPLSTALPDDLQLLTRRHAVEVSHPRFHSDVDKLIAVLESTLEIKPKRTAQEVSSSEKTEEKFSESTVGKVFMWIGIVFV